MFNRLKYIVASICLSVSTVAYAGISIPMYLTAQQGVGKPIGTITATESPYGVLLTPNLHGLPPGPHGFHIHENPSCLDNGMAAGDHLDTAHSKQHLGPYGKGHLGDLPALEVDNNGNGLIYIGQNISGLSKKEKKENLKETLSSPLNKSTKNLIIGNNI
jgi:Cu-Zn family superoxide dismutase